MCIHASLESAWKTPGGTTFNLCILAHNMQELEVPLQGHPTRSREACSYFFNCMRHSCCRQLVAALPQVSLALVSKEKTAHTHRLNFQREHVNKLCKE